MEISRLPHDVLFDILLRLPVKPLIRFSLSSKQYLSLIHHPHFINRHLTRSKINPSSPHDDNFLLLSYGTHSKYYSLCSFTDGGRTLIEHERFQPSFKLGNGDKCAKIVGSSNGLVCLSDSTGFPHPGDSIILWNVIIGKYKKLPNPYLSRDGSFSEVSIGFGFVVETNDFKVVQIMYLRDRGLYEEEIPDVLVYSMELNTWRKIEGNIALCADIVFRKSSVYVNGAVHWLLSSFWKSSVGDLSYSIMSFDMRGETFKEMGLPNIRGNGTYRLQMSASACGETLSVFLKVGYQWEVWLMKEYGVVDSWMRQFCIAENQILYPWKVMDSGDVLLEMRSRNFRKLVLCDAESQQINDLVLCDAENQKMNDIGIDPLKAFSIVTYTPSLSLLDGGERVVG